MTRIDKPVEFTDEEIVADLFRLARSGRFRKVEPLQQEAEALYPLESPARIKTCMKRLAEILWESDHGGYATEYMNQRRP